MICKNISLLIMTISLLTSCSSVQRQPSNEDYANNRNREKIKFIYFEDSNTPADIKYDDVKKNLRKLAESISRNCGFDLPYSIEQKSSIHFNNTIEFPTEVKYVE